MLHISTFSGIGGFDLASEWMGWKNIVSCEINEFGNKILEYYWPDAYHHKDIHTLTYDIINTELSNRFGSNWRNDNIVLTGGFPCQPYSAAGKRLGKEDERHLWPEMCRVIREIKPRWVVGENVRGLTNWNNGVVFDEVQADLEAEGYEITPFLLPACAVNINGSNAPHRRDRIWFVAHYKSDSNAFSISDTNITESKRSKPIGWESFPSVSPFCSVDDIISDQLDSITFPKWRNESIKGGGNAIVPAVALQIFKAIAQFEKISK